MFLFKKNNDTDISVRTRLQSYINNFEIGSIITHAINILREFLLKIIICLKIQAHAVNT